MGQLAAWSLSSFLQWGQNIPPSLKLSTEYFRGLVLGLVSNTVLIRQKFL